MRILQLFKITHEEYADERYSHQKKKQTDCLKKMPVEHDFIIT